MTVTILYDNQFVDTIFDGILSTSVSSNKALVYALSSQLSFQRVDISRTQLPFINLCNDQQASTECLEGNGNETALRSTILIDRVRFTKFDATNYNVIVAYGVEFTAIGLNVKCIEPVTQGLTLPRFSMVLYNTFSLFKNCSFENLEIRQTYGMLSHLVRTFIMH
jgi:hypothetical protein